MVTAAIERAAGAESAAPPPIPLYAQLKDYVRSRIATGEWPPHHRVPSENELVDLRGVSRMTANRALRELAAEGVLVRIRGKGSFVAAEKRSSLFQRVPNIADEIALRGGRHGARVALLKDETSGAELAEAFGIEVGAPVVHSIIVHAEDGLAIQIEDRFVNPALAPDYARQDFAATTPNGYLSAVAPIVRAEQFIEAVAAEPWECRLLDIARAEPCLLVRRRTWCEGGPVSVVRLLYPGSRYRLETQS